MSTSQFVYVFLNPGLELWLKKEIQLRSLPWTLSFSKPGYMTFKVTNLSFDFNQRLDLAFARSWGKFEAKESTPTTIEDDDRFWESYAVKVDEHWSGSRVRRAYLADRVMDGLEFIEPQKNVSRTYYKTAQAFELLNLAGMKHALEIGCAPGGSVSFLLEQGMRVTGIDPGEVDETLKSNESFTHLKWPIQRLTAPEISGFDQIDILSVDLNLKPEQALHEVLRFIPELKALKVLLMIFKVSRPDEMWPMKSWLHQIAQTGARETFFLHLPAHRHETLLVARYQ